MPDARGRKPAPAIGDTEQVNDDSGLLKRGDSFASRIPYAVPDSLDDLTGPTTGIIELPHHIEPVDGYRYNLDDPESRAAMYVQVISEAATTEELSTYLNRDLLRLLWPQLNLPRWCRKRWHERFPELAAIGPRVP
jgi:hypothetical protein